MARSTAGLQTVRPAAPAFGRIKRTDDPAHAAPDDPEAPFAIALEEDEVVPAAYWAQAEPDDPVAATPAEPPPPSPVADHPRQVAASPTGGDLGKVEIVKAPHPAISAPRSPAGPFHARPAYDASSGREPAPTLKQPLEPGDTAAAAADRQPWHQGSAPGWTRPGWSKRGSVDIALAALNPDQTPPLRLVQGGKRDVPELPAPAETPEPAPVNPPAMRPRASRERPQRQGSASFGWLGLITAPFVVGIVAVGALPFLMKPETDPSVAAAGATSPALPLLDLASDEAALRRQLAELVAVQAAGNRAVLLLREEADLARQAVEAAAVARATLESEAAATARQRDAAAAERAALTQESDALRDALALTRAALDDAQVRRAALEAELAAVARDRAATAEADARERRQALNEEVGVLTREVATQRAALAAVEAELAAVARDRAATAEAEADARERRQALNEEVGVLTREVAAQRAALAALAAERAAAVERANALEQPARAAAVQVVPPTANWAPTEPALATRAPPRSTAVAARSADGEAATVGGGRPSVAVIEPAPSPTRPVLALANPTEPLPTAPPAGAAARPRVFVHFTASDPAARARAERVAAALAARDLQVIDLRAVPYAVGGDRIRYFFADDAARAAPVRQALEALTGGTPAATVQLQDFSFFRPSPTRGTIEVWLAGG